MTSEEILAKGKYLFNYKYRLKEDYLNKAKKDLNITDETIMERISKMYDDTYRDSDIFIHNSETYKDIRINSADFFYKASNSLIINENGVLILQSKRKRSIVSNGLMKNIDIRQVFKRKKQKAEREKDRLAFEYYKTFEKNTKLCINGYYGLSGYAGSYFFNVDNADTCTTGGRNIIAVSSLTNELLGGGFRHYELSAHLKLIERARQETPGVIAKYTLRNATVDEVLQNMLLYYYEDYYAKSFLKHTLEQLTQDELNVLFIKNNFEEFIRVPEVHAVVEKILKTCNSEYLIEPKKDEINYDTGEVIKINPFKEDMKTLGEMSKELVFGFCYYEGDYYNGEYKETMVDIVSSINRKKIVLMDTDSNVTILAHEKMFILNEFKDIIEKATDPVYTEGSIIIMLQHIYVSAITRGLQEYAACIGIDKELAKMIDLECEHVIKQLQLTILKKNYIFKDVIHDFFLVDDPELETRGLKATKSDANSEISAKVMDTIDTSFMVDPSKLDYEDIIFKAHRDTINAVNTIKSDKFIIEKKTVSKIKDEDTAFGDSRMKAIKLWDRLYPEQKIDIPGSFGLIRIKFTTQILNRLKADDFAVYKQIADHARDLYRFGITNKVANKVYKLLDEEDEERDDMLAPYHRIENKEYKKGLRDISKLIRSNHNKKQYNFNLYDKITKIIESYDKRGQDLLKSTMGLPKGEFNVSKFVCDKLTRIAVPIDINTVPELLKRNNYEILDIEAGTEYEHLLSPLTYTASIGTPRNKNGNGVVTNFLQVF